MKPVFLVVSGETISVPELTIRKAKSLSLFLLSRLNPLARLVELKRSENTETVIFDVDVERAQHVVNGIRFEERIAVHFTSADSFYPEVHALRSDFPLALPHTNLRTYSRPVSICLYEAPYAEVKVGWTAQRFVEEIRGWLSRTAEGTLHQNDQDVEPFLPLSLPKIILPASVFELDATVKPEFFEIRSVKEAFDPVLIAVPLEAPPKDFGSPGGSVGFRFETPPLVHSAIRIQPQNFLQLAELLNSIGFDLVRGLRMEFRKLRDAGSLKPPITKCWPTLLVSVPHKRTAEGPIERIHLWAFVIAHEIAEVGEQLGLWEKSRMGTADLAYLLEVDDTQPIESLRVETYNPVVGLSPRTAATHNGLDRSARDFKGLIVGLGAVGGYLLMNLTKVAFGKWTLVDHDSLMPHNFAKHAAPPVYMGKPKAAVMEALANFYYEESRTTAIVDNILEPRSPQAIHEALRDASLILDCSASIAVARMLAHNQDLRGRCASIFLNPAGSDLVVFVESRDRRKNLVYLEMQYYRALVHTPELVNHLRAPAGRDRYARSCGDITSTIPNEVIEGHVCLASQYIQSVFEGSEAAIEIWQFHANLLTVTRTTIAVAEPLVFESEGWTIATDSLFLDRLRELRLGSLPDETGGILIGQIDVERKTIYVFDAIDSPSDSESSPLSYVRGTAGTKAALDVIHVRTAHQLTYVGEWHSHPEGYSPNPSKTDLEALRIHAQDRHRDGLPAAMFIIGHAGEPRVIVSPPDFPPSDETNGT